MRTSPIRPIGHLGEDGWRESSRPELLAVSRQEAAIVRRGPWRANASQRSGRTYCSAQPGLPRAQQRTRSRCESAIGPDRRRLRKRFLTPLLVRGNRGFINGAPPAPVERACADYLRVRGCAYLARFQTTVAVPPPDAAATVYFSSSPVTVKGRFCSVPFQLGNVAVSILKVKVLSAALMDKVPK